MKFFRSLIFAVPLSLCLWGALISGCSAITLTSEGVRVAGFLDDNARADFATVMPAPLVILNSDGGLVAPTAQMAGLIQFSGADTRVDGQCASACAMLYAAGIHRSVTSGSRIGVHQSDAGSIVDNAIEDLMINFGTPLSIVNLMMKTPNSSIHWLTYNELQEWNNVKVKLNTIPLTTQLAP